jgi:carboxyl-terminal processing protease
MAEKYHVQPRPMDEFLQQKICCACSIPDKMVEEVRGQQNNFLKLVTGIYEQRVKKIDSLLLVIQQQPFSFTADEKITVAEDSAYPANTMAQQQKLVKFLKSAVLEYIIEHGDINARHLFQDRKKSQTVLNRKREKKRSPVFSGALVV